MADDETLPRFTYLPDPVGTGSIVPSELACRVCGRRRGYVSKWGCYGIRSQEIDEAICPWCIADGSAHERFDVSFNTGVAWSYGSTWDLVPPVVEEEIVCRTPSFFAWQEARWWTHCGDGAEFLGYAGTKELTGAWADAVDVIREDFGPKDDADWAYMLNWLHKEGDATAYVFRCRHCGKLGGFLDFN